MSIIDTIIREACEPADLYDVSTADLLNFYNRETGKETKKFASRSKGIEQVLKLVSETTPESEESVPEQPKAEAPAPAPAPAPEQPKPRKANPKRRVHSFDLPPQGEIKQHREGTARAKVIELCSRPEGATYEEVMEGTGWDDKKAYEGIRLIHFYLGWGMLRDAEGRIRLYKDKDAWEADSRRKLEALKEAEPA